MDNFSLNCSEMSWTLFFTAQSLYILLDLLINNIILIEIKLLSVIVDRSLYLLQYEQFLEYSVYIFKLVPIAKDKEKLVFALLPRKPNSLTDVIKPTCFGFLALTRSNTGNKFKKTEK